MTRRVWSWLITTSSAAACFIGCGGNPSDSAHAACPPETKQAAGTSRSALSPAPARIFLTTTLLGRLAERAQAGDAAWVELRTACDAYAGATVNPPSGAAYPTPPNIGQGYQGEDYVPAISSLGLCYRVASGFDAAAADRYAAAGIRVLDAMSTPASSGGFSPSVNHGYGIRNYGVGMALGYDWLAPALSAATRTRVQTALAAWFDWYDVEGFSRSHPVGNYFVGYFEAKTFAALALDGDDTRAATYWSDVSTHLWGELVKPTYSEYLAGGGWPEGWGYGPRAVRGLAEVLWAVKTAKNVDWYSELPQVRDQAEYVSYFAWPSLARMDDHGTVRAGVAIKPSATLTTALATILGELGDETAPLARSFAADVIAKSGDDRKPWQKFLYWDGSLAQDSYKTRALSYVAPGPGNVAMRSSWEVEAVWGSFSGGAYINAPESGEQTFNSGALVVVRGDQPLLVNATGWLPQTAFTAGEDFVYQDTHGGGGRRLYNVFYVDDASNPYNPGQSANDPTQSSAHIAAYEDGGEHVFARADGLADQYGVAGGAKPVQELTREVVFMRPNSFVVFDRSKVALATADQWLAFHVPTAPTTASVSDSSQRRLDVSVNGEIIGSLRTLLPAAPTVQTVSLPGGTTRIEIHAPARAADQQWLTVVTASGDVPEQTRLSAADGNVLEGDAVGVALKAAKNQVVLFASGSAPISATKYVVAQNADAHHVLAGVASSANGYEITGTSGTAGLEIAVTPGGPFEVSTAGTLSFDVSASGSVSRPAVPPPTEAAAESIGEEPAAPAAGAPDEQQQTSAGSSEPCP